MKNPKNGKEKKRIGYNYLGMAGIMVIALVLLGSLMLQSKTLERRRDYYDSKATALEKSIESEKERTKEIEAEKEHMKTDEYVEEAAREKLGLVKDNEIVFQDARSQHTADTPGHGKNCLFGKNEGKRRNAAAL